MPQISNTPGKSADAKPIRVRQMLGKYRIEKKVGQGGFSTVFAAYDTIEGVRVALKVPHGTLVNDELMEMFRKEVRIVAKLEHPNVLQLKDASLIDNHLVVVSMLGNQTLNDRLKKRLSVAKAFEFSRQMIAAVAYAHEKGLIHCDIKPENFILFDDDRLRLGDFGIAKVSWKTIQGSGTGTVGHIAPEQAMGKPSARSDVFSLGLIMYRMLTGSWPEFPFDWPFPNAKQLKRKLVHPEMVALIRRALAVKPRDRFADATIMQRQFERLLPKSIRFLQDKKNGSR